MIASISSFVIPGMSAAVIIWAVWHMASYERQSKATRATLIISGPHLHCDNVHVANFWRMHVHNDGPATAVHVEMHLIGIDPKPRDSRWASDYPYPVVLVGPPDKRLFSCRIIRGGEAKFEPVSGWRQVDGGDLFFTRGLDTKNKNDIPILIGQDERWRLTYVVNAENAKQVEFSLEIYVEDNAVIVKRTN